MAYTLNGVNLGDVETERCPTKSEMEVIGHPMRGSSETAAIDIGQVTMRITLKGVFVGATRAEAMNNFVWPIKALENGNQSTVVFHSDAWDDTTTGDYTDGNIDVKVEIFDPEISVENGVCVIRYTLELVESV